MWVDKQLEFSNSQAITTTAISANVYDTGGSPVLKDLGEGASPTFLVVQIDQAFTAAGAATLQITLESDSVNTLAASPTVHYASPVLALATLVPGFQIMIPLPLSGTYERWLGLRYTVATGPMTAGQISAFITTSKQTWRAYPIQT